MRLPPAHAHPWLTWLCRGVPCAERGAPLCGYDPSGCARTWAPCTAEWTALSRRNQVGAFGMPCVFKHEWNIVCPRGVRLARSAAHRLAWRCYRCCSCVYWPCSRCGKVGAYFAQCTVLPWLPDWRSVPRVVCLLCCRARPAGLVLRQSPLHDVQPCGW